MNMSFAILLSFLLLSGIAEAGHEIQINQALANGGNVHLASGVYNLEGPVIIHSNTVLSGEPDTILRVSSSSNQWFTPGTGIICSAGPVDNVRIEGFSIDGNCQNLPRSYANTPGHDKDCEKAIVLKGYSNQFSNNISIERMRIYDCFSDAIYIGFANNVFISELEASNCQHSTIYLCEVKDGIIEKCEISGITSDDIRVENAQRIEVMFNVLFAYLGDHNNGAYEGGQNLIQISNQGYSHGYGSPKPDSTKDINVHDNVFSGPNWHTIWINSVEQSSNIWIHNNSFLDVPGVETNGIDFEHPPTIEQSEKVFSSIFDILNQDFSFQYLNIQVPINASVSVAEYNNTYNPHSLVFVDGEGLTSVKYSYNGNSTTHYYSINGKISDIWTGDLQHKGNAVYLPGKFEKSKLQVTCFNSQGYSRITDFNITQINDSSSQILRHELWAFVGTLSILGFSIYRNLRRVITKW